MENLFLVLLVVLAVLAVADLIVGVSNDAVNFLNSAVGSRAIPFKTIMIVAGLGLAVGAVFSSGIMEVARKGIFNPGEFYFEEVMFIFLAVMITDVLLLDFFNTIGMPTSTTVSIVFELLGAAVLMAFIKVLGADGELVEVLKYINTSKAIQIISGILLSVVVSFSIGALVQYISRLLLSYGFEKKAAWVHAFFGGISLTAITYFILIKGIKGTSAASMTFAFTDGLTIKEFLETNVAMVVGVNALIWTVVAYFIVSVLKVNIFKVVIGIGTFSLALAFAGNDLVNFIGVPIAAYQSYEAWSISGVAPELFKMDVLASKVPTPSVFLILAGAVMVITLFFSKKARYVADTEINLARENEGKEKFKPNFLSRVLVRSTSVTAGYFYRLLPSSTRIAIDKRFTRPGLTLTMAAAKEMPAFDMLRASVNIVVAGIIISIATSYKLPLSTTYVTFMVAMGTSLADRAWGADSAVYRVAGVLNVIAGWFGTALIAFLVAGGILSLIYFGREVAIVCLILFAAIILVRNYIVHKRRGNAELGEDVLRTAKSKSKEDIVVDSAVNIEKIMRRSNKLYSNIVKGLATQDLNLLKKNKKGIQKLISETEEMKDGIYYFIKELNAGSGDAGRLYLTLLGYLIDIAQSLEHLSMISYKHIENNHKKLRFNQLKDIRQLQSELEQVFEQITSAVQDDSHVSLSKVLETRSALKAFIDEKIDLQIERTREEETSAKNTTLYFDVLLETRDLVKTTMNMLALLYHAKYDDTDKDS